MLYFNSIKHHIQSQYNFATPKNQFRLAPACSMLLALPSQSLSKRCYFPYTISGLIQTSITNFKPGLALHSQNMTRATTQENAFGLCDTQSILLPVMSNTVALLRTVKSSWRIVRSVQTVSVANGPYSVHLRNVHLIMTSGHSVLSVHTVRTILTNRNGPYAWLILTVLIPRYKSYTRGTFRQVPTRRISLSFVKCAYLDLRDMYIFFIILEV